MQQVTLSFLWHFHQPIYRDVRTKKMLMPWVRLHGIKDYTGMALLLEEFPDIRCTANFSPGLLQQLEGYVAGEVDTSMELLRDPRELSDDERARILETFFYANPDNLIGAFPRYRELHQLKLKGHKFTDAEIVDLQVLFNLAWFHPLVFARDEELRALRAKGRSFSAADRARVIEKQRAVLAEVMPRWKSLQPRVELSVSPFAHPIVPLLCSFECSGFHQLPEPVPGLRDDADVHVRRAAEWGERVFGTRPVGMWPSEGSVSEDACRIFGSHGFRWVATDEQNLAASLGRGISKHDLYRPWKIGDVTVLFRDLELSNLIGFTYKTWNAHEAAADVIRRVESAPDGSFVSVILDGENAWEHFPGGGVEFFRALYGGLSNHPRIRTAPMRDALDREPARLPRLHAGSWIDHSFRIWIGHDEDVRAWNLLGRARKDLVRQGGNEEAWESLYAAEGSDWFWWFGDDFSSAQDAEFDALFRRHLSNMYRSLGLIEPPDLLQPVKRHVTAVVFREPWAMLHVKVDGRRTDYFEWIAAGQYDMSREYGAMAGDLTFLSDLFFGFDEEHLFLRLDCRAGVDARAAMAGRRMRIHTARPGAVTVDLLPSQEGVRAEIQDIFEASCPFRLLGVAPGEEVEFHLEFIRDGGVPVRFPTTVPLSVRVPTKDFEKIHWMA